MSKIQGIAKRPGSAPYVTNISNTLENLSKAELIAMIKEM